MEVIIATEFPSMQILEAAAPYTQVELIVFALSGSELPNVDVLSLTDKHTATTVTFVAHTCRGVIRTPWRHMYTVCAFSTHIYITAHVYTKRERGSQLSQVFLRYTCLCVHGCFFSWEVLSLLALVLGAQLEECSTKLRGRERCQTC